MANVNIIAMIVKNISLGIGIVEVERINRLIQKYGAIFLSKIFDAIEITYLQQTAKPANNVAARFAANEAFVKTIGTGIGKNIG
jgi:holo-[acyl-carrier protein] synthase